MVEYLLAINKHALPQIPLRGTSAIGHQQYNQEQQNSGHDGGVEVTQGMIFFQ